MPSDQRWRIIGAHTGLILQIVGQSSEQLLFHLAIGIHLHALLVKEITHHLIKPVGKLSYYRQVGSSSRAA